MKCNQNNLKELVYEGHIIPGYYINKQGELFSTRKAYLNQFGDLSMENVCYGGPMVKRKGTKIWKIYSLSIEKITHSSTI
jgi:hypothetical protein